MPTTGSGATSRFLFDALARRHGLVDRGGVDLTRLQRLFVAAATFHPSRGRWIPRFYWKGRLTLNIRSWNSRRVLRRVDEPFDLVVQIFGVFRTRGARYVLYIDNTIQLSRSHWPYWVPVEGRALERLYEWERRLYGDALHVFTQGTPAAQSVISFYDVPEERVSVVGAGANFGVLPDPPRGSREPVVLYVGADWGRKGGDRLVEAFRKVRAKRPDARLQIVGTTVPQEEPGIEVIGFVSDRERLADLYARASVFCLPSRFEPYGLAIAEAMAYELPCVVTRVGALDEIVLDGETGLVIPPDDTDALAGALLRLLDDPAHARRLGANGRSRVETHQNWDAVVDRMTPDLERAATSSRFRRGPARTSDQPGVPQLR